jgi:hypothetical protein
MNSSETIFKRIDELTEHQQVKHDLPFLLEHYSTLKDLGIRDDILVELFSHGLLAITLKETIDALKG